MTTKKTTTAKKPAAAPAQAVPHTNTGAVIQHCNIENNAAPVSPEAASALAELARASAAHANASAEHARAMATIANALKGAEAHMHTGISISDVKGF